MTTVELPSPVTYGTVKCNVGKLVGDITGSPVPDISMITGKIRITPNVRTIVILAGNNQNYILATPPEEWTVDNGKLRDRNGTEGIRLIASASPGKQPETVQYTAEFLINNIEKRYQPRPIVFEVVENTTVDLATVVSQTPVGATIKVNSYEDRAFVQGLLGQAQSARADALAAATAAGISAAAAQQSAAEAHAAIIVLSGVGTPVPPGTPSGTVVVRTA